jgi:hypothetical protein
MKKIAFAVGVALLGLSSVAFADETKVAQVQGSDAVKLDEGYDGICREAIHLQEQRIRDLRAAVEFDREVERKLEAGVVTREHDAQSKEEHARKFREWAEKTKREEKREAFRRFASWLETEARTDREFARERREAIRVINRGWTQANNAIAGHESKLAEIKSNCGGGG